MSYAGKLALVAVLATTLGCGRDASDADQRPSEPAPVVASQTSATEPVDTLQAFAAMALREYRYYAPAGDSAIDHYLALRERTPEDPGVTGALTELQPYLLIAIEQTLARGDLREAQRLLSLLARIDNAAPALPRLRDGLRQAELTQQASANAASTATVAAAEVARTEAEARKTAVTDAAKLNGSAVASMPAALRLQPPVSEPMPAPRPATEPLAVAPASPPSSPRALPRLLDDSSPRYPLSALKRKIEGSVQIAFTIQPDGRVGSARLVSATPAGIFDEAALAAVARWRFEATGQSVTTQRTLNFRLPKG